MIFKAVRSGRPYPDHELSARDWAKLHLTGASPYDTLAGEIKALAGKQ